MARLKTKRVAAIGALLIVGGLVLYPMLGGGSSRNFSTVIPAAANLVSGSEVKSGGITVGTVTGVEPVDDGRAARISMEISDPAYWPVPTDSTLEIRFGGTVSFSNRHLYLTRGTADETVPEEGELAGANVTVPVEADTLISYFDAETRADLKRLIRNSAGTLEIGAPALNKLLGKSAPLTQGAGAVFADLSANRDALRTLVRSTGSVVDAVDRSNPDIGALLSGAAGTFDAIADEAGDLQVTLDGMPAALQQTRSTLANADRTLTRAGALTDRLAPGVAELRASVGPLRGLMGRLRHVAPDGRATLRTLRTEAPAITGLLDQVHGISPRVQSIAEQATTEVGCLRPYSPEIVDVGAIWGDWISGVDNRDHLFRANVQHFLPAQFNSDPLTPGQAASIYPGIEYGFPRPPGWMAGQSWFQPQCGIDESVLDPTQDRETHAPGAAPPPPSNPGADELAATEGAGAALSSALRSQQGKRGGK